MKQQGGISHLVWQRGRPLLAAAVIAGAVFLAYYAVWDRYGIGPRVLASPEYLLTADGLELWYASGAGQDTLGWPDWIHRDVRAEIFSQARAARELNVMDDELVPAGPQRLRGEPLGGQGPPRAKVPPGSGPRGFGLPPAGVHG